MRVTRVQRHGPAMQVACWAIETRPLLARRLPTMRAAWTALPWRGWPPPETDVRTTLA